MGRVKEMTKYQLQQLQLIIDKEKKKKKKVIYKKTVKK